MFSLFFVYKPEAIKTVNDSIPAVFSYFNIYALKNFGDYWGTSAESSFFLHTWSLAVEEQFYLLFPFFILYSYKFLNQIKYPILIVSLLSLVLFIIGIYYKPRATFYLLPTRFWELALGGLFSISTIVPNLKKNIRNLFPVIGLLLILLSYFFDSGKLGLSVIFPVAGALLILKFSSADDFTVKILSSAPFTLIGKISYSIYLWHWPLIVLFKDLQPRFRFLSSDYQNILIIAITILLASCSYYFIENTTRRYRYTPQIVLTGILFYVVFIITLNGSLSKHYEYKEIYNKVINYENYYDVTPIQETSAERLELLVNTTEINRPDKFKLAYKTTGVYTNEKPPSILLLGDSHACAWGKVISEVGDSLNLNTTSFAVDGSDAIFDINNVNSVKTPTRFINEKDYKEYYKAVKKTIDGGSLKLVVFISRWDDKLNRKGDLELLINMIDYINSKKIKVLVLTQAPIFTSMGNINASQYLSYLEYKSDHYEVNEINKQVIRKNLLISRLAGKNVYIYDVYSNMLSDNKMIISKGKNCFYFDDDHLSYQGTLYHKNKLYNFMKDILAN